MSSPSCVIYENTLGGTRPRRHIAPQLRAAGIVGSRDCGTMAELMSNYYSSGRVTPDLIRSYRSGGEVGRTHRHYGLARDPPPDESFTHGIKSSADGGVRECLQPTRNALSAVMEDQLERMYLSSIRRPLGHVPAPPYDVPVPRGGFGICSDHSESVKRVLYSGKDVDILHPVGEHKDRGYDWERAGIDPTQYCFGVTRASHAATAADAMRYDKPGATILPKLVEDFYATVKAEVGKPRSYGFDNRKFEEIAEKRAVRRSRTGDGDAAREVLSCWAVHPATLKAQEELSARSAASGAGLMGGTAKTVGGGSIGDYGSSGGTFDGEHSMPLSRFSRTFGRKKSGGGAVALTELEDEARAIHLLYPSHYVSLGVKSEYFAGGRSLEDIRRLCKKVDFGLTDKQIDEVFATIAIDEKCGIEQFKNKAVEMGYLP